jgi:TPR repeat protein
VAEAVELYRRALELDAALAEAHYNLATLFDQQGDGRAPRSGTSTPTAS